ncbi:MAG TPA: hypothetical protein VNN73_03790 [Blastocatellia bacterium]|nr:hypothetical protein [Blastocatellia bacterium]
MEKIKAIKTLKVTGKMIQQGIELPVSLQQKRPNMVRLNLNFQGKSLIQAYDGQTGWKVNPFQGSSEPEKDGRRRIERHARAGGH